MENIRYWFKRFWYYINGIEVIVGPKLSEHQLREIMIMRDLQLEREENAAAQLSADIFQQALTNTLTKKRIKDFFDESDRLREEHENAET